MTYDVLGPGALDYEPCRYGESKLLFRGPERSLTGPYVACLGGAETYGRFVKSPFPALVERDLGLNCINFGIPNAGVQVFASDPMLREVTAGARVTVVQVMGAQNLANSYYAVHPRRNDRFVAAHSALQTLYRDVDFAEFHFNKHLLSALFDVSPDRFAVVRQELQRAWVSQMAQMLGEIPGKIVLLWLADHAPLGNELVGLDPARARDPLFVTRQMLAEVRPLVDEIVRVVISPEAQAQGMVGKVYAEMEVPAAMALPGPAAHAEAAKALAAALERLI